MNEIYQMCIDTLKTELIPAMGCTEPIAIAYASALMRDLLGDRPQKVEAVLCGNIIKNVKSVVVPNTGGLKGIEAAVAAGIVGGNADKKLEVIATMEADTISQISEYIADTDIHVEPAKSGLLLDIDITGYSRGHIARVRICNSHTNVVHKELDGEVLFEKDLTGCAEETGNVDMKQMSVEKIMDFIDQVDIADIEPMISRQIAYNMRTAKEGLEKNYGANIGKVMLKEYGEGIDIQAAAYAAAASDARMSGCELPVIIVSGSGNQGITASVPVAYYGQHTGKTEAEIIKAVALSDLITIHQKSGIGKLSAFCGAVCAGVGAATGITYLEGGNRRAINHTIVNALALSSGIICDGAKASCAGKIGLSVITGLFGRKMCYNDQQFVDGEGIVKKGVENTLNNVWRLGHDGMKGTDQEIISMMTEEK